MLFSKVQSRRAQSTVEYIIGIAAILAVLLVFFQRNGVFTSAVNKTFSNATVGMTNVTGRILRTF